ncbi:MAG: hypothetical protein D6815_02555 [Candidatus Dadabacteria bacterium]|nr:MAG: hypothetical protein D6815_02555 [Candidatus Dadabacteria bacterium]
MRRARRRQPRPPLPELDGLDLRGINLERLTPRAREHFWFTVNKHAHHLYATACDISIAETRHPDAPITAAHIQQAEVHRIAGARRSQPPLGWGLALDALMILGAATAGALATKPDVIEGAGILPMAVTLAATVAVFFAREAMLARTCR